MNPEKSNKESLHAYSLSIRYLAARARSIKEIKDYLYKKKISTEIISETISTLEEENLVNDKVFAKEFVNTREKVKPKSKFALKYELRRKGISDTIIDQAVENVDETKSAFAAVQPKLSVWFALDKKKMKTKMMNFLKNRGFGWEISTSTYQKVIKDYKKKERVEL